MTQVVSGYSPGMVREDIIDDLFYHSIDDIPFYARIGDSRADREVHQWRARVRRARQITARSEGEEWSVAGDPTHADATQLQNVTQIMDDRVRISRTAQKVSMVGVVNIFAEESQLALENVGCDIEHALIRGVYSATAPMQMAGCIDRTRWGSSGALPAQLQMNEIDAGSTGLGLTRALVRAAQQANYNDGEKADCMMLNVDGKFDCAEFTSTVTVRNVEESARVHYDGIDIYHGDLGKLEIVICRDILASETFLFKKRLMKKAWIDRVQWEKLAKTGDNDRGWWIGELTLENKKPWSTCLIYNITR